MFALSLCASVLHILYLDQQIGTFTFLIPTSHSHLHPDRQDADNPFSVFGVGTHWRLGCPCPFRVHHHHRTSTSHDSDRNVPFLGYLCIQCLHHQAGEHKLSDEINCKEKVTLGGGGAGGSGGEVPSTLASLVHCVPSEMRNCFHHRLLMTFFSMLLIFFFN